MGEPTNAPKSIQKAKNSFEEALYLDPNHEATIEAISMFMGSQEEKDFIEETESLSKEQFSNLKKHKIIKEILVLQSKN